MNRSPRFLIIRRDNIGDMICTTPLLHGIRQRYPDAYIAVLASSYNAAVLDGNPDVNDVFVFLKRQQRSHGYGLLRVIWKRWALVRRLKKYGFDYILFANGGWRFASQLKGKYLVGFPERDNPSHKQPDVIVSLNNRGSEYHEVVKLSKLGNAIGVFGALSSLRLPPLPIMCQGRE